MPFMMTDWRSSSVRVCGCVVVCVTWEMTGNSSVGGGGGFLGGNGAGTGSGTRQLIDRYL